MAASPPAPAGRGAVPASALRAARALERGFLPLLALVVAFALAAPAPGRALGGAVLPLFAAMMLAVSLTFHTADVHAALSDPWALALAALAVFGPLPLIVRAVAPAVYGPGAAAFGLVLWAALPTDISAPLFTAMGGGRTALAAVVNAIVTALAPVVLPVWFLLLTGVALRVPAAALIGELVVAVLAPTALGVALRTRRPTLGEYDAVWQATAAVVYLLLVGIVVSQDAASIRTMGGATLAAVAAGVLVLNVAAYALGLVPWLASRRRPGERLAYVLAVGEKEFSVAAAVVYAGGLDQALLVPAVVGAVLQVATATAIARWARRRRHR
jgi:BASS family bile acid:Na+ symporter